VPDPRLDRIAAIARSAKIIPTQLEFVDIAGLIRGASKGEGLGNQFLGNIRETDAIIHVLRCFDSGDITHVEGSVDPLRDAETVETELMLADLEGMERRLIAAQKKAKGGDKEAKAQSSLMERALAALQDGKPARTVQVSAEEKPLWQQLQLLTSKPILYVCNVDEAAAATGNDWTRQVATKASAEGSQSVLISAAIESEVALLGNDDEKQEFLASIGLTEPGLHRLIRAGYQLLELITFFTAGPKETRAWTVRRHATAPEAAGVIHSDFERGFIRAETIDYDSFVTLGGEQACREAGKLRQEGRDYIVQDGDIFHFRFNV
jgi:GTP-binding protein YchF